MANELCIIGQEKSQSNIKLLEEAKKIFDSVFFLPLTGISLGISDSFRVMYRTTDILKFKAVLPRIPHTMSAYAYQLLSMFPKETFMPVNPISFLIAADRLFLFTVLRKQGIDTINLRMTRSIEPAYRLLEEDMFPLIIRSPQKETGIVVKNKLEAKTTIDTLAAIKQPIILEDTVSKFVSLYVSGDEVVASVKKKTDAKDIVFAPGRLGKYKPNIETEHIAIETAKTLSASIARVDLSLDKKPRVVNVNLNPPIIAPSKVTKTNLAERFIHTVYEKYKDHEQRPALMRFFEDAKSVLKDAFKTKHML